MDRILVTIPAYNEGSRLRDSFTKLVTRLEESGLKFTLSIAEDGSSDNTVDVIRALEREFPGTIVQTHLKKKGRGWALRKLWSEIDADIYAFVDADLAAGPDDLLSVVSRITHGADLAIGSRYCPGAVVRRPPLRNLISLTYNAMIRLLFHENIRDHQCGLKAFSKSAKNLVLAVTHEDSWTWDTEVILAACFAGLKISEVPVSWTEHKATRTAFSRLLSDIYLHGSAVVRFRSELADRIDSIRTVARGASSPRPDSQFIR